MPAQHLAIKAAGEEVTGGALISPRDSAHHARVALKGKASRFI